MNWTILAIGKPKLAYARAGVEEYETRLRPFAALKIDYLKNSARETESQSLLTRSENTFRIALDERGEQLSSRAFAGKVAEWELARHKQIALLLGGADGHTPELRAQTAWSWSLSPLTLQHELALLVLLEQLYRAYSIKAGLPYHRD